MKELIRSINVTTNGTKSFEEIKQILKGKDIVQKYKLAYEELMKLDKEQCQKDCRYYSLYELLKRRFNPNPFYWEKKYENLINAEKYFNITYKCVENYWDRISLFDLANCYATGTGTNINDSKLVEYYKEYLKKRNQENSWALKENKYSTIQLGDEIINYVITYCSKDICEWHITVYDEMLRIECYRDLTDNELEVIAKKFIIERNEHREMSKKIKELYNNSTLNSTLN